MLKIQTERLILRPLGSSDANTTHEYASDVEMNEYMLFLPNHTMEEKESFLRWVDSQWQKDLPQAYEFAITLDGKHIGAVAVSLDETRQQGELGWIINRNYHGRGYATEASKAAMDFAINDLKVKKIIATCDYRNKASIKVMEKIGLTFEGNAGLQRNKSSDEEVQRLMYSLDDVQATKSS
jgi:RimJ/RimL family protein N-acetyltransferase